MVRRTLVGAIVAMISLSSCRSPIPERAFAFIDERGLPSLYDVSARRVIWTSKWPAPAQVGPAWSPDGRWLVYPYVDPSDGTQHLGIMDVTVQRSRSVSVDPSQFRINGISGWRWSSSGSYLVVMESGYPRGAAAVLRLTPDFSVIRTFVSSSYPVWSQDEKKLCYSVSRGPASPETMYDELVILDLEDGNATVELRGDPGFVVSPVAWSADGAVVYRYSNPTDRLVRDTKGRDYPNTNQYYPPPPEVERPPERFYRELEVVTGWSKNSDGEWLISGGERGTPHWITLIVPGTADALQVVKGDFPVWKPGVIR